MNRNLEIANVILNQLGGNKFTAMTGAKNYIAIDNGLRMTLAKNLSGANRLDITVNGLDLYDIRFYKYSAPKFNTKTMQMKDEVNKTVKEYKDIYCDQLQELFTETTGMYTRL